MGIILMLPEGLLTYETTMWEKNFKTLDGYYSNATYEYRDPTIFDLIISKP